MGLTRKPWSNARRERAMEWVKSEIAQRTSRAIDVDDEKAWRNFLDSKLHTPESLDSYINACDFFTPQNLIARLAYAFTEVQILDGPGRVIDKLGSASSDSEDDSSFEKRVRRVIHLIDKGGLERHRVGLSQSEFVHLRMRYAESKERDLLPGAIAERRRRSVGSVKSSISKGKRKIEAFLLGEK